MRLMMRHACQRTLLTLWTTTLAALVCLPVPQLMASDATANDAPTMTFHLPLDRSIKPTVAKGDDKPQFLGDADALLHWDDQGILGQGLRTGQAGQALRFKAKDNYPEEQGTLAFWMRGLPGAKWNQHDKQFHNFFILTGQGGWLRLYKYHLYNYTFLLSQVTDDQGNKRMGRINLPRYREDQWNFFAFTWTPTGRVSFYLNGYLIGQQDNFALPGITDKSTMTFGQWANDGQETRVIDEVRIYDKPLSAYQVIDLYRQQGRFRLPQQVVIPRTTRPVTIDGKHDDDAWQGAAIIPLAMHQSRPVDTVSHVMLTYDDQRLYLALRSPIPQVALDNAHHDLLRGFFKRDVMTDDTNVDHDDAFEINLIPNPDDDRPDFFRLVANTINTRYDYVIRGDRTIDLPWQPGWKVASTVSLDGWLLEASIPFAGIPIDAPQPGDHWQVNFHRLWKLLRNQKDSWTDGLRDRETQGVTRFPTGRMTFGGQDALAVRVNELTGLTREAAHLSLELVNHAQAAQSVKVTLATHEGPAKEQVHTLTAGERKAVQLTLDLQAALPLELRLTVASEDGRQVHADLLLPLYAQQSFDMIVRSYPSTGQIKIEGDVSSLGTLPSRLGGEIVLLQGEKVIATHPFKPQSAFIDQYLSVADLSPGTYSLHVKLTEAGKPLAEKTLTYVKQPLPAWHGNTLGISDDPPPPWTPVRLDAANGRLQVWSGSHDYDRGLLPTQIIAAGQPLLSGPVTLTMRSPEGRQIDLHRIASKAHYDKQTPARIEWSTQASASNVRVSSTHWMEYDGLTWVELTLTPTAGQATIDALKLTFPFGDHDVTLINPYDYSLAQTGKLPPAGWSGSLRPVWLGNEERGLQFLAQTSHTWHVKDRMNELAVVRDGDKARLEVTFIDQPLQLTGPRTFAFGFQATPSKPFPAQQRQWRIGAPRQLAPLTPEKDITFLAAWTTGWAASTHSSGEVYYPIPRENLTAARFAGKSDDGRPFLGFPYYQIRETWAASPEFAQFGDEWLRDVRQVYRPNPGVPVGNLRAGVSASVRSYQDFVLHGFDLLHDKAQPPGYYFDVSQAGSSNNPFGGDGYIANGQYQSTVNYLGTRRMMQRIYTHLKQRNPQGRIIYHASGQIVTPIHNFADIIVDGENHYSRLDRRDNRGYEKFLTLDTYRAEYMGHPIGVSVALLPQFTRAGSIRREEAAEVGPQPAEYLLGLVMLHDAQLWIAYFYDNDILKNFYGVLAQQGFATADYQFMPYWNQRITQPLDEKETAVSFYVDASTKKTLAVLMNMTGSQADVTLTLDFDKLGHTPATVVNASHGEKATLTGQTLKIQGVPSHAYRILVLE